MTVETDLLKCQTTNSSRSIKMDVLKGLAIMCMVLAHCGFPLGQEIYLFHMAVFFMASGYFYNDKNSESIISVCKYSLKKVIALYVPYVLCNGIFILLHNWFIELNLLTYNPEFEEIGGYGSVWGLQWPYDEAFRNASLEMVLHFVREHQFGGVTWFLRSLFVVSITHCIFMWGVKKLKYKPIQKIVLVATVVFCCAGATLVQEGKSSLSVHYVMFYASWLAYFLGILIRKKEHLFRYDLQSGLFAAVLLFIMKNYGSVSLNIGYIHNVLFYFIVSILGWILLRSISELLSGFIASALAYAGRYSMSIVLLHFLSFKVVTLAVILLEGRSMVLLASFPQIDGGPQYLWVAYTVVGMGLPLLANMIYQSIKQIVIKFLRGAYESIRNRCCRSAGS